MKFTSPLAVFFFAVLGKPVFAAEPSKTLSMYCFDQYYACGIGDDGKKHCTWLTGIGTPRKINLLKDPNYPNPNEPRTIWIGQHDEKINGAEVHLDLSVSELNGALGFSNTLSVSIAENSAVSSGGSNVRAALKMGDKGVGAMCRDMTLQ